MGRPFYTSRVFSVCQGCEYRHIGCHSECELYLDEKRQAEENKAQAKSKKKEEFITISGNKKRQKEAIARWYRNYGV